MICGIIILNIEPKLGRRFTPLPPQKLHCCCCCWVTVIPDSLWPHGLQHTRLLCPSLSPGICSNSCPLWWWCYVTISSSVAVPPSPPPKSFLASGSFLMSWHCTSGGQSIGALVSVLPMNIQGWFILRLTDLISLCSRDSPESSPGSQFKSINALALRYLSSKSSSDTEWL